MFPATEIFVFFFLLFIKTKSHFQRVTIARAFNGKIMSNRTYSISFLGFGYCLAVNFYFWSGAFFRSATKGDILKFWLCHRLLFQSNVRDDCCFQKTALSNLRSCQNTRHSVSLFQIFDKLWKGLNSISWGQISFQFVVQVYSNFNRIGIYPAAGQNLYLIFRRITLSSRQTWRKSVKILWNKVWGPKRSNAIWKRIQNWFTSGIFLFESTRLSSVKVIRVMF